MAKKSCKKGYYYCYTSKKCKRIPMGYYVGGGGWLRKEEEKDESEGKKKNGNGNGANGNGNGNGGSDGGSNGGGVSEAWSAKYKKSIDCNNPKGFSQRAHCRGRKMNEQYMTQQQRAEHMARKMVNQAKGVAARYDAAKKAAQNVKTTSGSVTVRAEEVIAEKRDGKSAKDKGYSLRDWFKGGGWVQAGGKYDGKPCARQPGQKTKPFCRDADDRANMSKKERSRRAAKKRREDPNPNRKGPAKMVSASYSNWRADLEQLTERDAWGTGPMDRIKCADGICRTPQEIEKLRQQNLKKKGITLDKAHYEPQGELVDEEGKSPFSTPALDRKKKVQDYLKNADKVLRPQQPIKLDKAHFEPEGELVDEGKKDACYHKVKSRYSVWPSAYASGALVKCRKVGAKNWGNKTKKEGYEFSNWRDDFQAMEFESVDIIKAEPLKPTDGIGSRMLGEAKKCWKGYKKVGTQKLFGKTYNRCEKIKKEEVEIQEAIPGYDKYDAAMKAIRKKKLSGRPLIDALKYAGGLRPKTEKEVNQKIGESVKPDKKPPSKRLGPTKRPFPQPGDRKPERPPGPGHEEPLPPWDDPLAKLKSNRKSVFEDWQKSNRKDGVDGMSQKSVNAYRRENPGSKLKTAVTGKVKKGSKDAKRRKSFCARSDGQRKMHNIDCSKTPDKKICKARRRWKC